MGETLSKKTKEDRSKDRPVYQPWYEGDFWTLRVRRMHPMARLMYRSMLQGAWDLAPIAVIPNETELLKALADCPDDPTWETYGSTVMEMFDISKNGKFYTNSRQMSEVATWREKHKSYQERGKKGYEVKRELAGLDPSSGPAKQLSDARKKGTHSDLEWGLLVDICGQECVQCHISIEKLHGGKFTKDHIRPIVGGGDDSIDNIQPMCRNCNISKGMASVDLRPKGWKEKLSSAMVNLSPAKKDGSNQAKQSQAKQSQAKQSQAKQSQAIEDQKPCAETSPAPVVNLILNDQSHYGISRNRADELARLYPAVNIQQELLKLEGWLIANPKNRKTRSGIERFVNAWMARVQDKGPSPISGASNNGKHGTSTGEQRNARNREAIIQGLPGISGGRDSIPDRPAVRNGDHTRTDAVMEGIPGRPNTKPNP